MRDSLTPWRVLHKTNQNSATALKNTENQDLPIDNYDKSVIIDTVNTTRTQPTDQRRMHYGIPQDKDPTQI